MSNAQEILDEKRQAEERSHSAQVIVIDGTTPFGMPMLGAKPIRPAPPPEWAPTQQDLDRLAAAEAKRERKAVKRRSQP